MDLYPGLLVHKIPSDRIAQIASLDQTHAHLTWDDTGTQTSVRRERFGRTNEWEPLAAYQDQGFYTPTKLVEGARNVVGEGHG